MSEITNPIVFYPSAIAILIFAILSVWFKNIFYSLISAIIVFFLAGLFFYVLGSEYNAVMQISIYGFAVPIILGLAIMFTNFRDECKNSKTITKYLTITMSILFILAICWIIPTSNVIVHNSFNLLENVGINNFENISQFANGIFINYVFAFEILSIILTIIAVGFTLFKKESKNG